MSESSHWDGVYEAKGNDVSWYQSTLRRSLDIIDGLKLPPGASAIDVGAGASTLADDLLERGLHQSLHAAFGKDAFRKLGHEREVHETPWGSKREFVYCHMPREAR